jgi:RecB family exonuclease
MRLAYTAMCRATTRVVWTCTTVASDDGRGVPSRFLSLVAGRPLTVDDLPSPQDDGLPATPPEAEAWLRRMVRNPEETASRRLAALQALVTPAPWRPRPASEFAGVASPGDDAGLVPTGARFSPSQAEAYLDCPRLYAFRRWLEVDADGSIYMDFGSLVHDVLEKTEHAAAERDDAHATLQQALATLDEIFDPAAFGGEPWSSAWHSRAVRILTHLYENWPSRGRAVCAERPVELKVGDADWRGRIDRIEVEDRPGERPLVRVVDYKTGTNPPSRDEAARSVQLGFYIMAAAATPDLAGFGDIAAAELWFPAVKQKSVAVRRFDPGRLDEVADLMRNAVEGIRSEDWTPQPGPNCDRCPVRRVCPEWPEGREAYLG